MFVQYSKARSSSADIVDLCNILAVTGTQSLLIPQGLAHCYLELHAELIVKSRCCLALQNSQWHAKVLCLKSHLKMLLLVIVFFPPLFGLSSNKSHLVQPVFTFMHYASISAQCSMKEIMCRVLQKVKWDLQPVSNCLRFSRRLYFNVLAVQRNGETHFDSAVLTEPAQIFLLKSLCCQCLCCDLVPSSLILWYNNYSVVFVSVFCFIFPSVFSVKSLSINHLVCKALHE